MSGRRLERDVHIAIDRAKEAYREIPRRLAKHLEGWHDIDDLKDCYREIGRRLDEAVGLIRWDRVEREKEAKKSDAAIHKAIRRHFLKYAAMLQREVDQLLRQRKRLKAQIRRDWRNQPKVETPEEIDHLNGRLVDPDQHPVHFVYFLIRSDVVVYVGQTNNLNGRINTHRADRSKVFDRALALPCLAEDLDRVEATYIRKLTPEYNKHIPRERVA